MVTGVSLAFSACPSGHHPTQLAYDSTPLPWPHAVAMGSLPVAFWSFPLARSLALTSGYSVPYSSLYRNYNGEWRAIRHQSVMVRHRLIRRRHRHHGHTLWRWGRYRWQWYDYQWRGNYCTLGGLPRLLRSLASTACLLAHRKFLYQYRQQYHNVSGIWSNIRNQWVYIRRVWVRNSHCYHGYQQWRWTGHYQWRHDRWH